MKKIVLFMLCFFAVTVYAQTNESLENIFSRTSIRNYTDKKVESEKIDLILKAAMAAPSAMNRQPWEFIVVTDKKTLKKLAKIAPNAGYAKDSKLAFIVCGDNKISDKFWEQDCSAATENLLLAVNSLGLGAVWCAVYPFDEKVKAVQELFNLPENIIPLNIIPVGYFEGKVTPKDKYKKEKIHNNKW